MSTDAGSPDAAPLSERICVAAVFAFAGFTLCAHLVVAAGGALPTLVLLYAVALAGTLFVRRRLRGRGAHAPGAPAVPASTAGAHTLPEWRLDPRVERAGLPVALAAGVVALALGHPIAVWGLLVVVLVAAAAVHWLPPPLPGGPVLTSRRAEAGLAATALLCALYTLVVHRPDADDAFYVNVAVAAVDHPELPLLARDTLHGRFDLPIHYAAYRLHAVELWNAVVSLLTGIPALQVFHLIAAPVAAAGVALAHATLFRRLVPRVWPWATLALVLVLGGVGETHRWYGNFAFVRMWQGKSIALFVFLPLVQAFAIDFARAPDRARWLRLAGAQIAALGCSATSLWAAPIAAGLALACALQPGRKGLRRLAIGASASLYLVVAGLLVKSGMASSIPELAEVHPPGALLGDALSTVLGGARLHAVGVLCLFAAWACVPPGLARRFAIVVPAGVALVLLDPFTDASVRANLTGPSYWRAMWVLPVPVLIALTLVAPAQRLPGRRGALLSTALVAVFLAGVPRYTGFSADNYAEVRWPGVRLGSVHHWSDVLNEIAPGRRVVAPPNVSTWIPLHHHHALPLMVRTYLGPLRERIGEMAYRDRYVMTRFAGGEAVHPRAAQLFERGLDLYDVQAVCLRKSDLTAITRGILRRTGFRKRVEGVHFEVWERVTTAPPAGEAS